MARTERILVGALVLALTVGAGTGLVWARGDSSDQPQAPARPAVSSVAVQRTSLSDTRELDGNLGFGAARAIRGTSEGVITWLPSAGTTIKRAQPLVRVNDRPTVLFYGDTPLYRTLDTVGSVGRDVRVVADNLLALGYDIGEQPAPGSMVPQPDASGPPDAAGEAKGRNGTGDGPPQPTEMPEPPSSLKVQSGDGVLTAELMAAIKRWQPDAGFDATGVLQASDAVVASGPVRVQSLTSRAGDPAFADLMTVTGTKRKVTVVVDPLDLTSIKRKQRVEITLPDQTSIPGSVTTISTIIRSDEDDPEGGGSPQLQVSVGFKQKRVPRTTNAVRVQVRFITKARAEVLAVPVGALLALREGGYAVQVSGGKLIPVETGLFSMGLVEISGAGIAEGTKVDTTS